MAQQLVKDETTCTEVLAYGIPYNFDDRSGKWTPWNLSTFIDGAEFQAAATRIFMDSKKWNNENKRFVTLRQAMVINPEVFKYNYMTRTKLKITRTFEKIGTTSLIFRTKLKDVNTGIILVDRYILGVGMNTSTHRPVKHSDWFSQKYFYLKHTVVPLMTKSEIPKPPFDCFTQTLVVRYSDLDFDYHTNQSVYAKFCLDCATAACNNKKLLGFEGDISLYPIVFMDVSFLGETFAGDRLSINVWQDDADLSTLKFVIYKDERQVNYTVMKFDLRNSNSQSKL
ncbi:unnamed protein product [Mytilus coruscus]|uniref:Acyl-ACP thioesterase n=1 Tax=Mytilus coruscus TaxID=42192 RepID=A0A6J8BID0_MYTCO|nr:unnamed protein product [Mytilus coruscus]